MTSLRIRKLQQACLTKDGWETARPSNDKFTGCSVKDMAKHRKMKRAGRQKQYIITIEDTEHVQALMKSFVMATRTTGAKAKCGKRKGAKGLLAVSRKGAPRVEACS